MIFLICWNTIFGIVDRFLSRSAVLYGEMPLSAIDLFADEIETKSKKIIADEGERRSRADKKQNQKK